MKLSQCLASSMHAGDVLRTDTNWEVVSRFVLVALAAGCLFPRRAHREGVQNEHKLVRVTEEKSY